MLTILHSHTEGSSLRGISRITGLAEGTVVTIVRAVSVKAQLIHNAQIQQVKSKQVSTDELWSFAFKKQKNCLPDEVEAGDYWIGLSLDTCSGLILSSRIGKHTDVFIEELVVNTEGKTDCQAWDTDGWGGYERVLPPAAEHYIGKDKTQRLERTNGIVGSRQLGGIADKTNLARCGSRQKWLRD